MKQEARRNRPTRKRELLNNISPELPYLFSCTIQRNIFIDYFLKSRFFSSSILESLYHSSCICNDWYDIQINWL
uniref:Uncharacterized protein n=1 Tax=Sinocyclocheilus grahami TaxID=75366 RepID=A0A672N8M7_SINGR